MNIVICLYNGLTALDAVGPYEVLSRLPQATVRFVAAQKGSITTDTPFLKLVADYELSEVQSADLLLIPGSAATFLKEAKNEALLAWIRKIHATTTWTASVCSGSIILGAAGLLRGLAATSHWATLPLLADYGAVPTRARYVVQGKVITAAGVSAGLDMSLYLMGQISGDDHARAVQLVIEYDPEPPFRSGNAAQADAATVARARALMAHDVRKGLSVLDMVQHAGALLKLKNAR